MATQSSWISPLAKTGYAAKGVVYAIIGVLAAMAAFGGGGGKTTDSGGALQTIENIPFGNVLLVVVGIGLACYSVYRLLGAFVDLEGEGDDGKGLAKRLAYLGSGLAYAALAMAALTGLAGGGGGGGENESRDITAKVLGMPGGAWIVGLVGVGIAVGGIQQWRKAATGAYRWKFQLEGAAAQRRKLIDRVAKLGLAARGLVFLIIAFFLVKAAMESDPSETKGLGGALDTLAGQPYGPWLLGITAIGLVCYGIYCWIIAAYGTFRPRAA
ncbi:DUF1206 domain-containing protein [soil metagenome]